MVDTCWEDDHKAMDVEVRKEMKQIHLEKVTEDNVGGIVRLRPYSRLGYIMGKPW